MNKKIDYSHLGGFPLDQEVLNHMQESYVDAFKGLAALCGDKTILTGVVVDGGNVTAGWITYQGELIPFVGGAHAPQIVIQNLVTSAIFEDNNQHNIEFTKYATCGALGEFPFTDLVPLLTLQNIWRPGDIKECVRTNAYIAANFDVDGYGLNAEKGWRILGAAYPDAVGKITINRNPADSDFNECGKHGGSKTKTLTAAQQGKIIWQVRSDDGDSQSGASYKSIAGLRINGQEEVTQFGFGSNEWSAEKTVALDTTGIEAFNVLNPYFVTLKLVKL